MASRLFITKPLEQLFKEAADAEHGLKRALSVVDLTMLGVGAIIGAGIFVLTGTAAAVPTRSSAANWMPRSTAVAPAGSPASGRTFK